MLRENPDGAVQDGRFHHASSEPLHRDNCPFRNQDSKILHGTDMKSDNGAMQ